MVLALPQWVVPCQKALPSLVHLMQPRDSFHFWMVFCEHPIKEITKQISSGSLLFMTLFFDEFEFLGFSIAYG